MVTVRYDMVLYIMLYFAVLYSVMVCTELFFELYLNVNVHITGISDNTHTIVMYLKHTNLMKLNILRQPTKHVQ